MKILAMSDQHGLFPKIPPCDLLLVAGDLCPDRINGVPAHYDPNVQVDWLKGDWYRWRSSQPATHVIATFGNHDFGGYVSAERARATGDPFRPLVQKFDANTVFAVDSRADYRGLKIYATPWCISFMHWAFMRDEAELDEIFARIPEGLDILLTHMPPHEQGDSWGHDLGSRSLAKAIKRAKPKVVVCGHIHEGFGHSMIGETHVYNVALLDDGRYGIARKPTVIDMALFGIQAPEAVAHGD